MGRFASLEVLESVGPLEWETDRVAAQRDRVERVRAGWDLLEREDRLLLKMHLEAGSSFDEIARVTGLNRSTVCRRIQRMIRRLSDETYARCEAHRRCFSEVELAVIRDHFVRGRSLLRICRSHHLCYYRARVIVERAREFADATKTG